MLYTLSQHGNFNRKNSPFLVCACARGACFQKKKHKCKKLTDEEIIRLYDNSKRHYYHELQQNPDYNVKTHTDWCALSNCGVTHFGLDPRIFKYSRIRYDTFHMICQVTRRMMSYLRRFINTQMYSMKNKFYAMLKEKMGKHNTRIWIRNKPFGTYDGEDIRQFINSIPTIVNWIMNNFIPSKHNMAMVESLSLWKKISEFLRKCKIYDDVIKHKKIKQYKQDMKDYTERVTEFYRLGGLTFLKKKKAGDIETFYLNVVRYYMEDTIKDTWDKYQCGVGIFTMQGFERRNKESKYAISHHNNGKGSILIQNIVR